MAFVSEITPFIFKVIESHLSLSVSLQKSQKISRTQFLRMVLQGRNLLGTQIGVTVTLGTSLVSSALEEGPSPAASLGADFPVFVSQTSVECPLALGLGPGTRTAGGVCTEALCGASEGRAWHQS